MNPTRTLSESLASARNEKDVENAYRTFLSSILPDSEPWRSPHGVDGILPYRSGSSILAEFKYDDDLKSASDRAKILIQVLFYLKKIESDAQSQKLPGLVFVGDVNEFFMLSTTPLLRYLERDLNWSAAPSSAWQSEPDLLLEIAKDPDLTPSWVWHPQEEFSESEVRDKITAVLESSEYRVTISPQSMISVFERWQDLVLKSSEKKRLGPQGVVALFMSSLLDRESVYQHPKSATKLVVEGGEVVKINSGSHDAFWKHFRDRYTVTEKREFTANKDRLVADETRRRTGEFMTPAIWVAEAHRHLDETLGEDWRERYVVWDCSCGTANLTRDYSFKRLYLSTLNQEDVDTVTKMRYNGAGLPEGAQVFQFDFLNDDVFPTSFMPSKVPQGLLDALQDPNQPVLFLNNPPYGTANNKKVVGGSEKKGKAGTAATVVASDMKSEGVGASNQLYTQFMFKMAKILDGRGNAHIALFCKSDHMRSSSYSKFTSWWLERFKSEGGFIFQASEFADVSGAWAVCWNVWSSGKDSRREWEFDVMTRVRGDATERISKTGAKALYLSDWRPSSVVEDKEYDRGRDPVLCNWRLTGSVTPKSNEGTTFRPFTATETDVAYFNRGNFDSPITESMVVFAASAPTPNGKHVSPRRVREFATTMALRDLAVVEWYNQKDEFIAPDESHPERERWWADTLLFLPLCGKGEFSGLRNLEFADPEGDPSVYQVKNHWALLTRERAMTLADQSGFEALYADAELHSNPDRIVTPIYDQVLSEEPVSDIGRRCFEEARRLTELVITSGSRKLMCDDVPEYHLQAWDAGWKQTRKVLEQYHVPEYRAWKALYDEWRSELRDLVYELGYLRR